MKLLGVVLIVLGGMLGLGGLSVVAKSSDPGVATLLGAFAGPALLIWWGVIALDRSKRPTGTPTPNTHVKCPDCKELVLKEARVCKHCGCKLVPLE
jgi:hypothetical protein